MPRSLTILVTGWWNLVIEGGHDLSLCSLLGICFQQPDTGGGGGGTADGGQQQANPTKAANNEVPQNPCNHAGRNLDPSARAAMGQGTKNNPVTTTYDFMHGFSIGGYLDAQPMATGSTYEKAAYGNYVSGHTCQPQGFRFP